MLYFFFSLFTTKLRGLICVRFEGIWRGLILNRNEVLYFFFFFFRITTKLRGLILNRNEDVLYFFSLFLRQSYENWFVSGLKGFEGIWKGLILNGNEDVLYFFSLFLLRRLIRVRGGFEKGFWKAVWEVKRKRVCM